MTAIQAIPLQQGLVAPQPFSLRTSFRALSITRIEIKESVIYTAKGDRDSSSRKAGGQHKIPLYATDGRGQDLGDGEFSSISACAKLIDKRFGRYDPTRC